MEQNLGTLIEHDLDFVEATVANLKDYLLGRPIYWRLSHPRPGAGILPRGTLGGLLLRLHRLRALEDHLTDEQLVRLDAAEQQAREGLHHWRAQAEEKAHREIHARVDSWGDYLQELEAEPERFSPEYQTQVQSRVALEHLLDFVGRSPEWEHDDVAHAVDRLHQATTTPSDFIWNPVLAPAYPRDRYPWLYTRPGEA